MDRGFRIFFPLPLTRVMSSPCSMFVPVKGSPPKVSGFFVSSSLYLAGVVNWKRAELETRTDGGHSSSSTTKGRLRRSRSDPSIPMYLMYEAVKIIIFLLSCIVIVHRVCRRGFITQTQIERTSSIIQRRLCLFSSLFLSLFHFFVIIIILPASEWVPRCWPTRPFRAKRGTGSSGTSAPAAGFATTSISSAASASSCPCCWPASIRRSRCFPWCRLKSWRVVPVLPVFKRLTFTTRSLTETHLYTLWNTRIYSKVQI